MTSLPGMRLSLLSPELVLAADPKLLRAFLAGCGGRPLAALVSARRAETARALWGRLVHIEVAEGLDELARLATPSGRDAIVEAARDAKMDHAGWEQMEPVDLAATILADRRRRRSLQWRALLRLARLPHERPTYELRGAEPRGVPEGRQDALVAGLRRVVAGWSEAWIGQPDETGDVHGVLLYGPRKAPRADAFWLRASEGRLVITTARPQRLEAYGVAWGRALYEQDGFFLRAPSLTLKPLMALGAAGLTAAKLPPEVKRARVVACQLDSGETDRLEAQGPDALARLEPFMRAGGHPTRATLRFDIEGEDRPVDALLQLPHRIDVGWGGVAGAGARGPRLARDALAALGLLSPGTMADDVTTLLPLVHPEWRWRDLVGDAGLEAMQGAGVLERVAGRATRRASAPNLRWMGRNAIAFPLFRNVPWREPHPESSEHTKDIWRKWEKVGEELARQTWYYVVPDDWSIQAVAVSQDEMDMLRLSVGALMRKGRREMGLERGERPKLPKGVLWVGDLRLEQGVVRVFYVVRAAPSEADRAALGRAITKAAGFGRAVALVPAGRKLDRGFVELELTVAEQLGAASWRSKVREAVKALGLEDEVLPAPLLAPEDARLVLDPRCERAVLDGVTLEAMGESGYRLLLALAQRGPGAAPLPSRETDRAISGARLTDGATRNAVWRMPGWIDKSFEAAGKAVPDDVKRDGLVRATGRLGWTLTVKAHVT